MRSASSATVTSTRAAPEHVGPGELRVLAGTINDMARRLDGLVKAQRAFVADASHQLRTPLTALRLRLENLASQLDGPATGDMQAAISEGQRLAGLIDVLLALARAEGTRPERLDIDVGQLATQRLSAWSALAEETNVSLTREGPAHTWAKVVPGYLEQVLDNLLANALDASPRGSTVTIRTELAGRWIDIHVCDRGLGMSEEDRGRAFDRFWRRDPSTGVGTGLGLAIVDQLLTACRGTADLRDNPGGGTDAVVRLERGLTFFDQPEAEALAVMPSMPRTTGPDTGKGIDRS